MSIIGWLRDTFIGWNGHFDGRVTFVLALLLAACDEHEPRPCERLPHHDSTGHVVLCDCTCSDDPAFACPATVVECTHPELADRWSEESSSDEG